MRIARRSRERGVYTGRKQGTTKAKPARAKRLRAMGALRIEVAGDPNSGDAQLLLIPGNLIKNDAWHRQPAASCGGTHVLPLANFLCGFNLDHLDRLPPTRVAPVVGGPGGPG